MEEFDSTLLEQYFRRHRLLMHGLHERRGCARTAYSGQGRVLKLLRIKPEISQREMAEILGIRPQSLGETLNRLEAAGYIERRTREDDRRSLIVCLTDAGAEAARDERGQSSGDDGLFDCLSAAERSQLASGWDGHGYMIPVYLGTIRSDAGTDHTHLSWSFAGAA